MRKNNKKELKKDFKNHMVESLELPKDLVYRAAIVTVMGNRESVVIENLYSYSILWMIPVIFISSFV